MEELLKGMESIAIQPSSIVTPPVVSLFLQEQPDSSPFSSFSADLIGTKKARHEAGLLSFTWKN
jgi:hypothetical protein